MSKENVRSSRIRRAQAYLQDHYAEEISLVTVAEEMQISSPYLSVLFKEEQGMSFRSFLNRIRVDKAKGFLTNTDLTLLDVSLECGFNDQSYFTKVFKKYEGITPKEYRRREP